MDVGNNYSVLENNNISFVYDDIDARNPLSNMDLSGEMVNDLVGARVSLETLSSYWVSCLCRALTMACYTAS